MKIRLLFVSATSLILPALAQAQPVTGPYVSLGAGTSIENPVAGSYPAINQTDLKYQFRSSYAGIASAGYGFGNGLRVELSGDYIRNTLHEVDGYAGDGTTFTHFREPGAEEKYGPMFNVLYDFSVGLPIYPYVGGGIGYQFAKFDRDLNANTGGTKGSFAYDLIGGVSYPLRQMPGLSLTADYRFMMLTQSRNYPDIYGFTGHFGQESSHTFTIGLRYQLFNAPVMAPAPAPAPTVAPAPAPAKTYLVFFDWNKYDLTPRATQIIAEAASDSKTTKVTKITVSGYTDTSGTATYNQGLSVRRAKAVAVKLMADGVPASEISIFAYGETHLLVPTGPGVREPQNRRVEIVLK